MPQAKPAKPTKPAKPYDDFPLYAHANRQWAKRIRGDIHYFGSWANPEAALAEYLRTRDYLQAGQVPPTPGDACLTMEDLCNEFLESKERLKDSGDLAVGTWHDYHRACRKLLEITGNARIVDSLRPKDFDVIRAGLVSGVSKVTQANRIRLARSVFKFANDQDLIKTPLKFGQNFKQPDRAAIRAERQAKPSKEFTADELRKIIDAAKNPIRAMILLGINCGFGNNDCASLPRAAIDLERAWIEFPRPKTAIERRCPLWPETVKALRESLVKPSTPKDDRYAGLAFVTKYGAPYVRVSDKGTKFDAVAGEFAKILSALGIGGNRRAFYSLRRQFETVAGNSRDQIATDHIMGHSPASDDMSAVYRQSIADERLTAVSDFVRAWLWPSRKPVERTSKPVRKKRATE